ncbi:MAG: PAS domain-containing protein, partial [Actinobacteria bacterium]|nr:PAS domain-containing protein [Actinomycetota bacterium]
MVKTKTTEDLPTTFSSGPPAQYKALQVASTYAILGAIWIIFSDQIVDWITNEDTSTLFAQTIKGILYVAVTSVLVYWLALRAFHNIEDKIAISQRDQTQRLLDAVLGNLGEAILLIDPTTRTILQCNTAATTVFGYSESELPGQSTKLIHVSHESYLDFGATSEPELETNGVYRCQSQLKRKDGAIIDVEITVVTLHREVGWRTGVVSIIRDISDRVRSYKALEASEHRYRVLAENTVDVIWSMDPNLKLTYVNPAIFKLTGYTPNEALETRIDAYFDDLHLSELKRLIAREIQKGPSSTGVLVDTEI